MIDSTLDATPGSTGLVPVMIGGCRLLVEAQQVAGVAADPDEETEIAGRAPRLEHVLDGLVAFANEAVTRFEPSNASKISVEFGCNIGLETGSFLAVIGKASAQSAFKVTLEWSRPAP